MIDIPEFRQRIDTEKNLLVLDVRTPEDFIGEQGHIEDAVNIPAEELQQRMNEIGNYLEHPVAIVCGSEKKSAKTARLLTEAGFTNVHIVRGGMAKWIEAGLPVIR
jgi:rhodanese-related sulfurtransferase